MQPDAPSPALSPEDLSDDDRGHLLRACELAREATERGDHPFGAVLVDGTGAVLGEGRNTCVTARDVTGHAETNVVREVARDHDRDALRGATLYASTEPCAMCAASLYWAGVGRVVFAFPGKALLTAQAEGEAGLDLPLREVVARAVADPVEVVGPVDLEEASAVHEGFWAPR